MPTIFYKLGFRFYFVSYDCREPAHVHVGNNVNKICKYWLKDGIAVFADNSGFNNTELRKIERIINENYEILKSAFDEFCKEYRR